MPLFLFYFYAFSRRFYPKRLTVHLGYTFSCQYYMLYIIVVIIINVLLLLCDVPHIAWVGYMSKC